jgi:hypothetical protein
MTTNNVGFEININDSAGIKKILKNAQQSNVKL